MSRAPYAFAAQGAGAGADLQQPRDWLDRADDLRGDADALAALWLHGQVLHLDPDGRARGDADGPVPATGEGLGTMPGNAVFLGRTAGGQGWFAVPRPTDAPEAACIDLRSAALAWPALAAGAFATARAVQAWHGRTRHCGLCGGAMAFARAGWLGRCTQCDGEHYPRIDAAVIAAVSDGPRLLLGRQASWPDRRWSLIAGFVEPGESLEQTVAREVLEETGVRVRHARYRASQPWPFPGALMLGFDAQAEPDTPRAGDELEDARWFTRQELRAAQARDVVDDGDGIRLSPRLSIARWLIDAWIEQPVAEHTP